MADDPTEQAPVPTAEAPAEQPEEGSHRLRGTVKWFNATKVGPRPAGGRSRSRSGDRSSQRGDSRAQIKQLGLFFPIQSSPWRRRGSVSSHPLGTTLARSRRTCLCIRCAIVPIGDPAEGRSPGFDRGAGLTRARQRPATSPAPVEMRGITRSPSTSPLRADEHPGRGLPKPAGGRGGRIRCGGGPRRAH
jgi:hypothetical protein